MSTKNLKNNPENLPPSSRWSPQRYNAVIKKLRRYFSGYSSKDGYDLRKNPLKELTSYRRKKIRDQFKYIDEILSGVPKRAYRARTHKRVEQTLKAQGVSYVPKNLKVAFIPDIGRGTEVRQVKSRKVEGIDELTGKKVDLVTMAPIETVTMDVTRRYLFISPEFLIDSPLEAIREAMALSKAKLYTIQAGVHEITEGEYKLSYKASDKEILSTMAKLMKKYGNTEQNNHWQNWLGGLIAYNFHYKSEYNEYRIRTENVKIQHAKKRKTARKKEAYAIKTAQKRDLAKRIKELQKKVNILKSTRGKTVKEKNLMHEIIGELKALRMLKKQL